LTTWKEKWLLIGFLFCAGWLDLFGLHFQNIFSPYAFMDQMVAARDACGWVVLGKVFSGDRDRLDRDFLKEEFFCNSYFHAEWQSLGMDGFPCELYKVMCVKF